MRDPETLWGWISKFRKSNPDVEWEEIVGVPSEDYDDGGHISNDPAEHHSKTSQKDNERISGQTELEFIIYDVTKDPDETLED